jgi:hypothetical protein
MHLHRPSRPPHHEVSTKRDTSSTSLVCTIDAPRVRTGQGSIHSGRKLLPSRNHVRNNSSAMWGPGQVRGIIRSLVYASFYSESAPFLIISGCCCLDNEWRATPRSGSIGDSSSPWNFPGYTPTSPFVLCVVACEFILWPHKKCTRNWG